MAEGVAPLQKFVASYVRNPAGIAHELVVIYKGYDKAKNLDAAKSAFALLPHIGIEVSDDGFDVNAYLAAARRLDHDYVCFLNTFTEIASRRWLSMLYQYAASPRVGIVGAMGSYESLYDSYALIHKVIWLCNDIRISRDERIAQYYDFVIDKHCKAWKAGGFRRTIAVLRVFASRIKSGLRQVKKPVSLWPARSRGSRDLDERFREVFEFRIRPKGSWTDLARFPPFPNPHIRSNGFMMSRQRFLEVESADIKTKFDACAFESGIDSMTSQIRRKGLRAVVVGRSGQGYDVADWVQSGTFRLGNQENLILTDNQSRTYDVMTPGTRATHVRITWGDFLGPPPPTFPDLGFKYATNPLDPR